MKRFLLIACLAACKPGTIPAVIDAGADIAKIVKCVDDDLMRGMSPVQTALDCGMKDAAAVEDLVGAVERLAAHRRTRDAGPDASGDR